MEAIPLCDITKSIYRYLRQYTTIYCLTQFYFARGDMFRLFIQPSSGQLTIGKHTSLMRFNRFGFLISYIWKEFVEKAKTSLKL
jgi:hypothetical protein